MRSKYLCSITILLICILIMPSCYNEVKTNNNDVLESGQMDTIYEFVRLSGKQAMENRIVDLGKGFNVSRQLKTIAEKCESVVFSDTYLEAWNNATAKSIYSQIILSNEGNLIHNYFRYKHATNFRFYFAKKINDDKYLDSVNFAEEFYIIEYYTSGNMNVNHSTLIVNENDKLRVYCFKWNNRNVEWELTHRKDNGNEIIDKKTFLQWYKKTTQTKNLTDKFVNNTREFVVSKISASNVESIFVEFPSEKIVDSYYKVVFPR